MVHTSVDCASGETRAARMRFVLRMLDTLNQARGRLRRRTAVERTAATGFARTRGVVEA